MSITILSCDRVVIHDFESPYAELVRHSATNSYAVTRVDDVVRRGSYAVRFELRQGDKWRDTFRSEYKDIFAATMGKEYWYGISMLIPSDFPEHDNRNVVMQWHATRDKYLGESSRSPVLAFRYRSGILSITVRHSSKQIQNSNDGIHKVIYEQHNYTKGVWNDFIINSKWSYEDDGFVNVWLNGTKIVNYKGPVGYNDAVGPYFNFGIYRDDVPQTYVIYFDEYRRGKSYKDVDPSNPKN